MTLVKIGDGIKKVYGLLHGLRYNQCHIARVRIDAFRAVRVVAIMLAAI